MSARSDPSPKGRVIGLGGIFFKSRDPAALAAWYRDVLGIGMEGWDGAMFAPGPDGPPFQLWSPFKDDSDYFAPSSHPFMLNFAVDDLDAFLARLADKGVEPLRRDDGDDNGRFAWILDPDGTKLELWEPKTD
ncbi:VOC family protein [Sphingobium nicotianae]|uniref:VOC family protein n=1 Tax=Sphingobium nicotianae TaxID=2782607 RepID=A0A9X1IR70_9SPHN|nr:VOC family protein [Sphingobium nicotianae]MBT2187109.1 VOC family protein [Sphingobium nicotianae]